MPNHHHSNQHGGNDDWDVSTIGDLEKISDEKEQVDNEHRNAYGQYNSQMPAPSIVGNVRKYESRYPHSSSDCNTVSSRKISRSLKYQSDPYATEKECPVHSWNIDLSFTMGVGMENSETRHESKHRRLFHNGEHARDQRLRSDDCGQRRDDHIAKANPTI